METFGIPNLMTQGLDMFEPITSVHKWGVNARGSDAHGGLVHFYTDDYKFKGLWQYPQRLLHTGCKQVIEVNFSTYYNFPLAYMLWELYQKRTMSLMWQREGILVWVDMNVDPSFYDYNLASVPREHLYYATRYLANYPRKNMGFDSLHNDYNRVLSHCYNEPLFLVYGGGEDVMNYCQSQGWLWIPDKWRYEKWGEVQQHQRKVLSLRQSSALARVETLT